MTLMHHQEAFKRACLVRNKHCQNNPGWGVCHPHVFTLPMNRTMVFQKDWTEAGPQGNGRKWYRVLDCMARRKWAILAEPRSGSATNTGALVSCAPLVRAIYPVAKMLSVKGRTTFLFGASRHDNISRPAISRR